MQLSPWMRWVGSAFAVAATGFLIIQFREHAAEIQAHQISGIWFRVLISAFAYGSCGILLGLIWWLSVRGAGGRGATLSACIPIYMASQVGKYLPGNFAHLVARHWVMRNQVSSHAQRVTASFLEALSLLLAAGLLSLLVIREMVPVILELGGSFEWILILVLLGLLAVMTVALGAGRRLPGLKSRLPSDAGWFFLGAVLTACLFFLGMGACFLLVSDGLGLSDWPMALSWVAAAWIIGFLVPGAPGGIGVREFVLVFGLAPIVGEPSALLSAALFRLVTMGGDGAMALAGWSAMKLSGLKP